MLVLPRLELHMSAENQVFWITHTHQVCHIAMKQNWFGCLKQSNLLLLIICTMSWDYPVWYFVLLLEQVTHSTKFVLSGNTASGLTFQSGFSQLWISISSLLACLATACQGSIIQILFAEIFDDSSQSRRRDFHKKSNDGCFREQPTFRDPGVKPI